MKCQMENDTQITLTDLQVIENEVTFRLKRAFKEILPEVPEQQHPNENSKVDEE